MQKERKDDAKEPLKPRRAQDTIKGVSASATFGLQAQLLKRQQEVKAQASGSARLTASERGRLGLPGRKDWKQQPNPGIAKRNARDIALTQSEQGRLDHSTLKLRAKQELYEQYAAGIATPPEECTVDFTVQRSPHYMRSPSPEAARESARTRGGSIKGAAQRVERASPTYEPYQGRRCENSWAAPQDGELHHQNHSSDATVLNCDSEEWPWRGATQARVHNDEAYWARKARQVALDARVAELQVEEAREKEQRSEKRKAEAVVVKEMAAQAEQIQQEKAAKTAESKKRKRALLDQLIERKVKQTLQARKATSSGGKEPRRGGPGDKGA